MRPVRVASLCSPTDSLRDKAQRDATIQTVGVRPRGKDAVGGGLAMTALPPCTSLRPTDGSLLDPGRPRPRVGSTPPVPAGLWE